MGSWNEDGRTDRDRRRESSKTESELIAEFLDADFLNVDLDVRSRHSLAALLDA